MSKRMRRVVAYYDQGQLEHGEELLRDMARREKEFDERFFCARCGVTPPEGNYMVHDHVWREAMGDNKAGFLCLDCLEIKLGRKLRLKDFQPELPVNDEIFFGYEMGKRCLEDI